MGVCLTVKIMFICDGLFNVHYTSYSDLKEAPTDLNPMTAIRILNFSPRKLTALIFLKLKIMFGTIT